MRVLITGAAGFAGKHLIKELLSVDHEPFAFDLVSVQDLPCNHSLMGDLNDTKLLTSFIKEIQPEACIHLGGISFVPMGWSAPQKVLTTNLIGTVNLLDILHISSPQTRTLIVTSTEVYGSKPPEKTITETTPFCPDNPYAVTKASSDWMAQLYSKQYNMPIMIARPSNHIGPGQSENFVVSSFARQLAEIKLDIRKPIMTVGNLKCERTFADVRDVVRAYRLIIEAGHPSHAYNISSGNPIKIQTILDVLCKISDVDPKVETDKKLWRPTSFQPQISSEKLTSHTSWKSRISLKKTLIDIFQHTFNQMQKTHLPNIIS